jgi:hypothetical protein
MADFLAFRRQLHAQPSPVDSIVIGVYRGKELYNTASVRAGFVSLTRRHVFE